MDIEHIKSLVELMVDNDLSRIEIQEGETHILLRRGQPAMVNGAPAMPAPAATAAAPQAPAPEPPKAEEPAPDSNEIVIKSPMVGTFYTAPDPESAAFVNVGDHVQPDTVVCIVEAMKVFNEIKAEVSGRITKRLVNNGDSVEYNQPLFAIAAT